MQTLCALPGGSAMLCGTMEDHGAADPDAVSERYLDLLKKCLTRAAFPERYKPAKLPKSRLRRLFSVPFRRLLRARGLHLVREASYDPKLREEGRDRPPEAETMVGLKRLDNVQRCVTDVVRRSVPGDLIETGVWRGGTAIFMRAVLRACGDDGRTVWAADSFQGLPEPDAEKYPADRGDTLFSKEQLAVSVEEVKANFERYGLLDERVKFLVGWFKDTLPAAPIERLAVLRLDGDLYESTMDALTSLYPKLSPGGYVIVDDYGAFPNCKQAIHDFRDRHGIKDEIVTVDWTGVYWRRSE